MRVFLGVDLGSTTSKALLLDADGEILGTGITNSRSNYEVAVEIARTEAFIDARMRLLRRRIAWLEDLSALADGLTREVSREFRHSQHLYQLEALSEALLDEADRRFPPHLPGALRPVLEEVLEEMRRKSSLHFQDQGPRSAFFRDLAASDFMRTAQECALKSGTRFESLIGLFDKAIIQVENQGLDLSFPRHARPALENVIRRRSPLLDRLRGILGNHLQAVIDEPLEVISQVGTGYGRARLPFPREQIRSEILCHGMGAHRMFPRTRTVLDIGGQDTKAIQVDGEGIVTSFQMNDRCAAGCGRYLGYIADELNLGLHELGPLAQQSCRPVKINSTCTVFAGAELRDRLTAGQKREDILAGLHRAIILRALSLLARSGGVFEEFTFTGGVANNAAAVGSLRQLVQESYGNRVLNVSSDSIYTGALGAALHAMRREETDTRGEVDTLANARAAGLQDEAR